MLADRATDPLLALLADLVAEVRALRCAVTGQEDAARVVFAPEAPPILKVSRSHLDRVIRDLPEHLRPAALPTPNARPGARPKRRYFWRSEDELLEWWAAVTAPPEAPAAPTTRRPRKAPPEGEAVTDWRALIPGRSTKGAA
jgi:hypothetical protein